jgi:tetratricopeptide (TPR) repeat protein
MLKTLKSFAKTMFPTKARTPVLCLGLTLVVLAAYANHFQNKFHFDDSHTIVENRFVRDLRNVPGFFTDATRFSVNPAAQVYRPLVSVSLAIDYRLGKGYVPFFFHLSTFLWFAVQLILMFFLFRRIMDQADPHPSNLWTAFLAAACYGLHPANAETVNYIIQRADLYSTLGVVASLLCFAAYPGQRKRGWYLLPAIAAYLSKAPALIYPLLLLSYVFLMEQEGTLGGNWSENRTKWAAAIRAAVPALLVTAAAALFTWKMTPAAYQGGATSPWLYRATQPWVALHYFLSFFLPTGLSADSDWTPVSGPFSLEALAGYLFVAALLVVAFRTSRHPQTRPIAFGILWFILALLPASLMAAGDVTNDHRMFFPFVGLALGVFWSLRLVVFRKTEGLTANPVWLRGALAAVVVALALAAVGTHLRNQVWRTDESLWQDVTVKSPKNARGMMNYGMVFLARREYDTALSYLQRAESLNPAYGPVEANLGVALGGLDRNQEAEQHFRRAVELAPNLPEPYIYYARWLIERRRLPESQALLEAALQRNRLSLPARELLAQVYNRQGNRQAANQLLEDTVRMTFGEDAARRYMAELAERQKRAQAARYPEGLKPEELVNLSAQFCNQGNYADCLGAAQKALDLRPGYAEAYNNMAAAFLSMGRWDDGITAARQAIQSKPNYAGAKSNLDWGLSQKAKAGK